MVCFSWSTLNHDSQNGCFSRTVNLGILEDEEELDKQFGEAADEVRITFFLCDPNLAKSAVF